MTRPLDVVLCGYYGFGNLGDELLARALVELLEEGGIPRSRVGILSADPAGTRRALGTESADRWSLPGVARMLGRSRTLLLGGGGLLQDATSLRSCVYYWGVVQTARCRGCIPWAFGQSVGPLGSPLARRVARGALAPCVVRVVRDRPSLEAVRGLGLGETELAPDPVLGLSLPRLAPGRGTGRLGVNLRPWKGEAREGAIRALRELAERAGRTFVGLALAEEDRLCLAEARDRQGLPLEEIRLLDSPESFSAAAAEMDGLVAMRLHALVLSVLAGLPAAAVPYDPKVTAFSEEWELPIWTPRSGWSAVPFSQPGSEPSRERLEETRGLLRAALTRCLERLRGTGGWGA